MNRVAERIAQWIVVPPLAALCLQSALAQPYPGKPIRVIVPYPAGGVVDVLLRTVGQQVSESLGQPLVVDNRPGANTIIALEACAKSPPDGYTLCSSSSDGMSHNPNLYPKLPYDPDRDFAPITQMVWVPGLIVANGQVPYDTVKEMIAYAKGHPGVINFASFGIGSTPHFFLEWFRKQSGADMVHIPYKGSAQIIPAMVAGEAHVTFIAMGIVLPLIKSGKMKPLAVTNAQRSFALPNVTTLAEQGVDPKLQGWFGVFAPARTPKPVVDRLNAEFVSVLRSARFQEQFLKPQAYEAVGNTAAEFAEFLKADRANAAQVIRITGIRLEESPAKPSAPPK